MTFRDASHLGNAAQASAPRAGTEPPQRRLDVVVLMVAHQQRLDRTAPTGPSQSLKAQSPSMRLKGGRLGRIRLGVWPLEL